MFEQCDNHGLASLLDLRRKDKQNKRSSTKMLDQINSTTNQG